MGTRRRLLWCVSLIGVSAAMTAAAFAATTNWGTAVEVPGTAALNTGDAKVTTVSCASAGNCAAGGYYNSSRAFVVSETSR